MLDAEEARLRALECTTADDFLTVVAIKRQLGTPPVGEEVIKLYRSIEGRSHTSVHQECSAVSRLVRRK